MAARKYPFPDMEVGDYFDGPKTEKDRCLMAAYMYARRDANAKFSVKDGPVAGTFRCTRVAKVELPESMYKLVKATTPADNRLLDLMGKNEIRFDMDTGNVGQMRPEQWFRFEDGYQRSVERRTAGHVDKFGAEFRIFESAEYGWVCYCVKAPVYGPSHAIQPPPPPPPPPVVSWGDGLIDDSELEASMSQVAPQASEPVPATGASTADSNDEEELNSDEELI